MKWKDTDISLGGNTNVFGAFTFGHNKVSDIAEVGDIDMAELLFTFYVKFFSRK